VEANSTVVGGGRSVLERSPLHRLPDRLLKWGLTGLAVAILALIAYFFIRLIGQSSSTFNQFGLNFVFSNHWAPQANIYKAAAMLVGTLITSATAMLVGVPVAVATALYLTEICPRRARTPLSLLVDLLAAVPSVVYGLWGVFFLGPKLEGAERWFANTFSFIPWFGGGASTIAPTNYFIAGLILAIMILPIVSAISREVLSTVPSEHREASLALGATRWEMIRTAVLPEARPGIVGASMLGRGRALGETIAVVLVIGDAPDIGKHWFDQGYTLASVIANEFGEATGLHRSALFAAGLVLFVLTLLVNIVARMFVTRSARGKPHPPLDGGQLMAGGVV